MARKFNTAGPNQSDTHYTLPPLARIDLREILGLIEDRRYFLLHAPRQTGKTSCLLALRDHLNKLGTYRCVFANVEAAQALRENVERAMLVIGAEYATRVQETLGDDSLLSALPELRQAGEEPLLNRLLSRHAAADPRPLVVFFDEVDTLIGDTLISFLRQLRAGYDKRPAQFPQTVVLCGVRDVRDYRIYSSATKEIVTGGSAFHIKAESLRLGDFTREDIVALYGQHTSETGQVFEPGVVDRAFELTQGQPWLANALAHELTWSMRENRDRSRRLTLEMLEEAKERLILRRDTHLDQLAARLEEERVRGVIEPMLCSEDLERAVSPDDIQYVVDLGLARRGPVGLEISNPVYREVVPRELSWVQQLNLESRFQVAWYVRPDGRLDLDKLLSSFQEFFREHSEHWLERFQYKEAGPQLILQAFLQRVVNGGGRIEREYGMGRGRTDLLVIWPVVKPTQKAVIELKIVRKQPEKALAEGLEQTVAYMDRCGTQEAHLLLFDRRPDRTWDERIFRREEAHAGKRVVVWGV
ncbi:MAG: ATP-binding protein [Planctomycetes bacterium]|nr:ATP-binding protein [Planctomycetota bacterium]